ncbi:sensor of ECF-type sigma factor [Flavobacterium sp.]|uniref:sensor of ECF-type sigma factor n=1 Tax=Flavobacterium sp. TaxID=239 RepID=UPI002602814B|nr:sensor of ECF-type sigma factor [Flavobacterium sp.]MDD3004597.1 sensor of ECF-type sigma factor [Flavobacterium sp.]
MKTSTFFTVLFLLCSISFYGQDFKKEKIKSLKIAHITKTLNLSSSEAEKFWPIYNAFEDKQYALRTLKMRKIKRDLRVESIENITETEANSLLNQMDDLEEELVQNKKKLTQDLRKVISASKILRLKLAEEDFNKSLLKQYRNRN